MCDTLPNVQTKIFVVCNVRNALPPNLNPDGRDWMRINVDVAVALIYTCFVFMLVRRTVTRDKLCDDGNFQGLEVNIYKIWLAGFATNRVASLSRDSRRDITRKSLERDSVIASSLPSTSLNETAIGGSWRWFLHAYDRITLELGVDFPWGLELANLSDLGPFNMFPFLDTWWRNEKTLLKNNKESLQHKRVVLYHKGHNLPIGMY